MRLWIDDLRPAPEGWSWALTSQLAILCLMAAKEAGIKVEVVSFDHDLGGDDTSRRVVIWMIENNVYPQEAQVHSANPTGVDWLRGTMVRYFPEGTPVTVVKYVGPQHQE